MRKFVMILRECNYAVADTSYVQSLSWLGRGFWLFCESDCLQDYRG